MESDPSQVKRKKPARDWWLSSLSERGGVGMTSARTYVVL